jgi:hypothetical protein
LLVSGKLVDSAVGPRNSTHMTTTSLRLLAAPAAAAALLGACLAGTAAADSIGPPTVNLYACGNGTSKTIAAGTEVTFGINWYAANRGLDLEAVKAFQISVTVNGVPLSNTDAGWTLGPADDGTAAWNAEWRYDYGPATSTMQITVSYGFSHPLVDRVIFNANGSPLLYRGIQTQGSCTVTVT